ncbi:reverse transcriptase domain-containing protein, partial [Tanacetum coccineum]
MLQGVELDYLELEKLILPFVYAARRLRRYFQDYPIRVLMINPSKKILARPDKSGLIAKWDIELGEHDIKFRGCNSVKGQVLADFLVEMPFAEGEDVEIKKPKKINEESKSEDIFEFETTNNEAYYKAVLAGLRIAMGMKVKDLSIF